MRWIVLAGVLAIAPAALAGANNDDCSDAIMFSSLNSHVFGDTSAATDDTGFATCGTSLTAPGVWYSLVGDGTTITVTTCSENTGYDTKLNVYCNSCDTPICVGGNDDDFGNPDCNFPQGIGLPSTVTFCSQDGATYLILVQGFGGAVGPFELIVSSDGVACSNPVACMSTGEVTNDSCADAIGFSSLNGTVQGTTIGALQDDDPGVGTCGTSFSAPGVWYEFIGDGTTVEITTCGSDITNYDTKINVYCGSCGDLTCVGGNDDGSPSGATDPNCVIPETGSTFNRASFMRFCTQAGAHYYVIVQGFAAQVGDFELTIRSDGQQCSGAIGCLPTGACCSSSGCSVTTQIGCDTLGGSYLGDNTNCGDGGYTEFMTCSNTLEDISGTGTIAAFASSGDDNAEEVGIPFTFTFFGATYNSVWVSSNGLLQFPPSTELEADDFTNDPIPSTLTPNRIISPLWDDLTTTAGTANVFVETRGTAPNRRFIVQWNDVPQLAGGGGMTFEAILFETSNAIEFRYLTVVAQSSPPNDYSIGIENDDGTVGFSVPDTSVVSGSCFRIEPIPVMSPCDDQEPCPDMDNSGLVDLSDLARLIASFGRSVGDPGYDPVPDFDDSGTVDLSDLALLLSLFGLPCP
ncbi:MAG: hypothetical protein KDA32_00390 [Phycisphaerales bacterium]|nr:hypothetical protein [Phycisphaerales bacterium]